MHPAREQQIIRDSYCMDVGEPGPGEYTLQGNSRSLETVTVWMRENQARASTPCKGTADH